MRAKHKWNIPSLSSGSGIAMVDSCVMFATFKKQRGMWAALRKCTLILTTVYKTPHIQLKCLFIDYIVIPLFLQEAYISSLSS